MVRLSSAVLLTKVNLAVISMCLLESKGLGSTGKRDDEGQLVGGPILRGTQFMHKQF